MAMRLRLIVPGNGLPLEDTILAHLTQRAGLAHGKVNGSAVIKYRSVDVDQIQPCDAVKVSGIYRVQSQIVGDRDRGDL